MNKAFDPDEISARIVRECSDAYLFKYKDLRCVFETRFCSVTSEKSQYLRETMFNALPVFAVSLMPLFGKVLEK